MSDFLKRGREKPTCYMCDAPSVGMEHAPPLCLFPKSSTHRKSLVTVPSCEKHNSAKSTDDTYLRWILATASGHNELAVQVLNEGAGPHLEKKPHLRTTFQPDLNLGMRDGEIVGVAWAVNSKRFLSSITAIVRGLFYYHSYFTLKILGEMNVSWHALKDKEVAMGALKLGDSDYRAFTSVSPNQPRLKLGANPRVFQYSFDQHSDETHDICALRFYEGETIYVNWKKLEPQKWSTRLESLLKYLEEYSYQGKLLPIADQVASKTELVRQFEERDIRLSKIMIEARHKRDLAALSLAKMLRTENNRDKMNILGDGLE